MSKMHTRYCTNCDEEFRPEILRCSDCGGELEDRYEEEDAEGRPMEAGAQTLTEPPDEYQEVYETRSPESLKEAAARLVEAGIHFRGTGNAADFKLLVRPEDVPTARAVLYPTDESATDEAQPFVGVEGGLCPACGESVPAGVPDCPGCGLAVGAEPARCDSCGSLLGPGDVQCPVCRAREG